MGVQNDAWKQAAFLEAERRSKLGAIKSMTTVERLTEILVAGREAAYEKRREQDGGTCNFDSAILRLPRVRVETVAKAAQEAGVDVTETDWRGRAFFVHAATGQGARRTAMAEAACKAMKEKILYVGRTGWAATVYYQMD